MKRRSNSDWSKTWSQRIRINDRRTNLGLGTYPVVTLPMAREQAIENMRRVILGEDVRAVPVPEPTAGGLARKIRNCPKST